MTVLDNYDGLKGEIVIALKDEDFGLLAREIREKADLEASSSVIGAVCSRVNCVIRVSQGRWKLKEIE